MENSLKGLKSVENQIVHLNVGGKRFSTSKSTLSYIPDTFFTSLLSGRIPSVIDDSGAFFIDRDPKLFQRILNYLRTKFIDLSDVNISVLKHEAEFYGVSPLIKRLTLCEEMENSSCGDILFHAHIPSPELPVDFESTFSTSQNNVFTEHKNSKKMLTENLYYNFNNNQKSDESTNQNKNEFLNLTKLDQNLCCNNINYNSVRFIRAHHNSVAVAYYNYVCCYRIKEISGWQLIYTSSCMDHPIGHIALVSKCNNQSQTVSEKMLAVSLLDNTVHLWCIDENNEKEPSKKSGTFSFQIDQLFFIGNQLVALSNTGKVGIWHSMTLNWHVQDVMEISCFDTAGSVLLLGCNNGSIYYFDLQKFPLRMKDNDLLITELYHDINSDVITAISIYLTPNTNICGSWIEIAYGTNTGIVRVIVQHPETVGHGPQLFQTFTVHTAPITRVALTKNHLISVCSEYNHVRTWSVARFRGMIATQPGGTSLASFNVLTLDSTDDSLNFESCNPGPYGNQDDEQIFVQRIFPQSNIIFVRLASNGERLCTIRSVHGLPITAFFVYESEGSNRIGARSRRFLFTGLANGSVQIWDLTTAMDLYTRMMTLGISITNSGNEKATSTSIKTSLTNSLTSLIVGATAKVELNNLTLHRQFLNILQGPKPEELLQLINECDICSSTPLITPQNSVSNFVINNN